MFYIRCLIMTVIWSGSLFSDELQADVPDPFGLGERLAIIDYLHDRHISVPPNPTIEELRQIYKTVTAPRDVGPRDDPQHDAIAERDRCIRIRAVLLRDYEITAPNDVTEAQLTSLLSEHRKEREREGLKATEQAAKWESITAVGAHGPIFSYNKFRQYTIVRSRHPFAQRLESGVDSPIASSALMIFHGMDLSQPPGTLILTFRCFSLHGWRLLESHYVVLMANGVRIDLGKGEHDGKILEHSATQESITVEISETQLEILANAKVIEGQIGTVRFAFSVDEIADIKELSGVIEHLRRTNSEAVIKAMFSNNPDKEFSLDCDIIDRIIAASKNNGDFFGAGAGSPGQNHDDKAPMPPP
jgi:hypothetical protein